MTQTTIMELFDAVDKLTRDDKHSEALRRLVEAVDWPALSDQHRQLIQTRHSTIQNLQAERFTSLQTELMLHLVEPLKAMGDPTDLDTLETQLEALATIDASRPLNEAERRLALLRQISEIEWAYNGIVRDVERKLSEASMKGVDGVPDAKKALAELRDNTLASYEQKADADPLAGSLVPRLRKLVEKTSRAVESLAERANVLTTQAGIVNFWAIEEEYQRWTTPGATGELRVSAPKSMPRMIWKISADAEGKEGRRYEAAGETLDLQTWHDRFIEDAETYAEEKIKRDLPVAKNMVKTEPLRAQQMIRLILEGDRDQGIRPYFHVPAGLSKQAREFLASDELKVAMGRYTRVQELVSQADQMKLSDPLGALRTLRNAVGEDVHPPDTIHIVRESVFSKVNGRIRHLAEEAREAVNTDVKKADQWLTSLQEWLACLPDHKAEPQMSQRLDPEKQLHDAHDQLTSLIAFCQRAVRLSAIESSASQFGVQSIVSQLDEFDRDAEAAGFRPDEFRLYRQLRAWLKTESDVQGQVAAKLGSEEIFPPDPGRTNTARLQEELDSARRGQHAAYAQLVGALEARSLLYRECAQSDSLTFEARKQLLIAVSSTRHVRPADKTIADTRLREVERLETVTQDQRDRIARSAAKADAQTLRGFQDAWQELDEALKVRNAGSLIGEIRSAQTHLRNQMTAKATALAARYPGRILDAAVASEIRQWVAMATERGAGEAERILEDHFSRFLWEWDAAYHSSLEERLRALLRLFHLEHDHWQSQLIEVGLQAALQEMEDRRKSIERGTQSGEDVDQSLVTRYSELRSLIGTNVAYLRKLAELSVWRREMPNARHYADQAAGLGPTNIVFHGPILTQSDVTSLLEFAEFREQIQGLLDEHGVPEVDRARRLQGEYQRLFRPPVADVGKVVMEE